MEQEDWSQYEIKPNASISDEWSQYEVKKKGPTLPAYGSTFAQYGTGSDLSQPRKYIPQKSKPKSLSEASADDGNYLASIWNTAVGSASSFLGGAANILTKATSPFPTRGVMGDLIGQEVESFVEKARSSASSKQYEEKLKGGFDVTDGVGIEDVKAAPLIITRLAADVGLSIPTFGTSFIAQGYNQGLKDYDEEVKKNPELRNENVRELFGVLYGTINGALDRFGADKILKTSGVDKSVKKAVLGLALKNLSKVEGKITADVVEKAAQDAARSGFNKVKEVGVRGLFAGGTEAGTEAVQGALSDGLKILANKVSDGDVFDTEEIKANFWKNRINDAAGGLFGGTVLSSGMSGIRSSDNYIAERVAESASKENVDAVKAELQASVENGEIDPDDAQRLNVALDSYVSSANRIPYTIGTDRRLKAIKALSDRDSLLDGIKAQKEEIANMDPSIAPQLEKDLEDTYNKIQFLEDQVREAVSGKKYKYFQDDTGKTFKQLVKPGSNLAKAAISKEFRAETAEQIPSEYYEFVKQDEFIPDEYKPKSVRQKKIDTFVDRMIAGEDVTSEQDAKFYQDNKEIIDQKIKENAVQEQTAGEVSVQQEATIGEEVETGKPKTEIEVTAEESQEVIPDEDLDIAIENLSNIKAQNQKLERATVSKKTKEMVDKSIEDSNAQLKSVNKAAVKRATDIEDNFDAIKQQLKDKGLLTSLQKGCI